MRKKISIVSIVSVLLFAVSVFAANKVVVIPLQRCADGLTTCAGNCVDTNNDPGHCGSCGINCGGAGSYCSNGDCQSVDGTACTQHSTCISGICSADTQKCVPGKLVFVTSKVTDGDIGGVTGADTICNYLATAAGLRGVYMAWLSDGTSGGPATRFAHRSITPYYRVDGVKVAEHWADLTDGRLQTGIEVTESGSSVIQMVWTNVNSDGTEITASSYSTCRGFRTNRVDERANIGICTGLTSGWTDMNITRSCDVPLRLYCFQQ